MKIVLRSDFHDYYDHWFDVLIRPDDPHKVFQRFTHQGLTRPEQFAYLASQGLCVPLHGSPRHLLSICPTIVVYDDVEAHRGLGKRLVSSSADINNASFASEYLPSAVTSHRLLAIGDKRYHLVYKSNDDTWRSNVGDVDITLEDSLLPDLREQNCPLYAIDFVLAKQGMIAIDFNTAPGIRGTGLEDILTSKEVATAIRMWIGS